MNEDEKKQFCLWLTSLNKRMNDRLEVDGKDYLEDWTEEVIIPSILYEILPEYEKNSWSDCDLNDIYEHEDIIKIFRTQPSKLNKCFSKRFYKLTKDELEDFSKFGQRLNTNLPINEILIIYSY